MGTIHFLPCPDSIRSEMTSDPKPRICVIGSAMVDLVARVPKLPVPGETLVRSSFQIGFGGKGSNQVVMAARLGADVGLSPDDVKSASNLIRGACSKRGHKPPFLTSAV